MQIRLNLDGQTRAQERRNFLRAEMSEVGTSGGVVAAGPSGALETPHSRLARLKNDLRELRTRYSDKYPDIVALEAEIAQLMREQAEAKAAAPKSDPQTLPAAGSSPLASRLRESLTEAETELKVLKAEEARLRASVATYQARVERIPQREQELKDLARDYETTREFYQSLLKRHDEAQIAESMEQRQKSELFRVIDPAAVPTSPITNRLRLVVMIAVLCVGLGAAAAVLAEQMDTSFHTRDQIRSHTSVPLLVSIPRIVTEADAAASRMRFRLSTVAVVVAVVAVGCLSYYMAQGNEQLVWILSRGRS
jgi:polysaccharide chain length determinant protein (PEP-CTERM system associated)